MELGGLSFRDIKGFNQAMLAKQVWRVLKHPKFLKANISHPQTFSKLKIWLLLHIFGKVFVWGLNLLNRGLRKNLGNGRSIQLFNDPWLPRPTSFKVVSLNTIEDKMMVDGFITPSL